jgi:CheY-like chemotaxis protein/HPt (histidine-containing phosphotransfer) domain-containing protein/anti-sigma regulatory factor (Ser/Thr protein kinase)
VVNQSANALLSTINDILDFSKIEAGKLELDIDKYDLYEIGSQATDIITYPAQKKGLEILLNIAAGLPRFIWTDAVRLKQVLVNLLGNAVKFTEKGEIELKIDAITDADKDQVTFRFEVRDTGIGIKPERQQKIFEAFSQEDASTTKKYGGTGLGLTISNSLLALMGSRLQLTSSPALGSIFYFDLTLRTLRGEQQAFENIEQIKRVLIVDDNDHNREILKQMLLFKNIASDEARNGFEALEILEKEAAQYDVIMMDYHMPHMDGLETIRKIRENVYRAAGKQPIIVLHSSSDDETILRTCEALQVDFRLVKPIKMQEMFNTLSRVLKTEKHKEAGPVSTQRVTAGHVPVLRVTHNTAFTILIAEDNEVNMLLAKTIIKRIAPNAMMIEAGDGQAAVAQYRSQQPDLVLMDIQMPEMNGYEATRSIREIQGAVHVPIIALTAGNVKGEREKCLAAGMDDFIAKPFVEASIVQVFEKWLTPVSATSTATAAGTDSAVNMHFDVSIVRTFLENDEPIVRDLLQLTLTEIDKSIAAIGEQEAQQDLATLKAVGHKLYGTSVTAGLSELARLTAQLSHLHTFDETEVQRLLGQVQAEAVLATGLIKAFLFTTNG